MMIHRYTTEGARRFLISAGPGVFLGDPVAKPGFVTFSELAKEFGPRAVPPPSGPSEHQAATKGAR
jgi:hypothetical protein